MTTDDILRMANHCGFRIDAEDFVMPREGNYATRLARFALLVRDQMLSEGWRQCAQGQRTTQHCAVAEQARQEAERYKASASMWRNKAYELGGYSLPWDADEMLEKARQEEREWLAAAIERQARSMSDHFETRWLHELAAAVRARGKT